MLILLETKKNNANRSWLIKNLKSNPISLFVLLSFFPNVTTIMFWTCTGDHPANISIVSIEPAGAEGGSHTSSPAKRVAREGELTLSSPG
jgi:hypothetical protein